MKESPVLRWASKITKSQIIAVAVLLAVTSVILGVLAVESWLVPAAAMQTLHLLTLVIAFSVLMWGFWGGIVSSGWAFLTVAVVAIIAGHLSLRYQIPVSRMAYWLESLLCIAAAYFCMRFSEREEIEETVGKRQLERLEVEFLELAVQYGKREDLHRILQGRMVQAGRLEEMAARLQSRKGDPDEVLQICLNAVAQGIGKGEAEFAMYKGDQVIRHPRGAAAFEAEEGKDEIDQWMAEHRTALLVNNLPHDVRFTQEFGKRRQVMSVIAVPLIKENRLIGTLRMTSVVPQVFSHDDLRFTSEAAGLLAPYLAGSE